MNYRTEMTSQACDARDVARSMDDFDDPWEDLAHEWESELVAQTSHLFDTEGAPEWANAGEEEPF